MKGRDASKQIECNLAAPVAWQRTARHRWLMNWILLELNVGHCKAVSRFIGDESVHAKVEYVWSSKAGGLWLWLTYVAF